MTASSDGWILFLDQRLVCGASSSACIMDDRCQLRRMCCPCNAQDSTTYCHATVKP